MSTALRPTPSAPMRAVAVPPPLLAPSLSPFVEQVASLARRLRSSVTDLTSSDRDFLKDVQRGRYPFRSLEHLNAIAARSPLAHHKHGLAEVIRADVLRRAPVLACTSDEVWDEESSANATFDNALRRFIRTPTAATLAAAREAGERQLASTRQALDTLYAVRG